MSAELKDLVDGIKTDYENMKKTNNEILKAKADAKDLTELKTQLGNIEKSLEAKQEQLAKIETAIKRSAAETEKGGPATEKILRKAFRNWLSKGAANSTLSDAIMGVFQDKPELKTAYIDEHPECKALAVSDDTAGGYMVHADLTGRIVKRIFETSPIRQYAAIATISTDALEGPLDPNEATAGWVSESGARSQTGTPGIGMWRIPTHELYAMPAATQKLLDDAAWDPEAWLAAKVADKFARIENAAFVNGNGDGKPHGFTQYTMISDADGASASYDTYIADKKIGYIPTGVANDFPAIPTSAAPTAQANPLVDLVYALKSHYRDMPGTAFAMHRTMFGRIRKLQDAWGHYLWQPGLGVGQPSTFMGYPIAEFNDLPAFNATQLAANPLGIWFANWREFYQIVDRIGIRVLRDPYTAKPFILFYTTKRTGGAVLNFEAGKALKFAAS